MYNEPTIYATGNEIYNCILTDNGDTPGTWGTAGQIEIGGQDGILIHDNIIDGTGRAEGHNADILTGVYYNKGMKYYRNKSYKPNFDGDAWNFHIELWDCAGGIEVYDNEFYGGDNPIDIAGHFNLKGDYAYSWYIHDNLFIGGGGIISGKLAIQLEDADNEDVWIYRNHFINWPCAINTTNGGSQPTQILRRIYIAYNIFDYGTWTFDDQYVNIFRLRGASGKGDFDGFYIYNNVIKGPTDAYTAAIKLEMESGATVVNFNVKNNIIIDNDNGAFFDIDNSGSIDGLYVDNNILYNNAHNNAPDFSGNSVNNYESSNNINLDPLFVDAANGNFHLQQGSPAINKGVNVGLTLDYEGTAVPQGNAPDIGAYEYH